MDAKVNVSKEHFKFLEYFNKNELVLCGNWSLRILKILPDERNLVVYYILDLINEVYIYVVGEEFFYKWNVWDKLGQKLKLFN